MERNRMWKIAALALALVCLAGALWLSWYNGEKLDKVQQEALEMLDANSGQYDENKIVLVDTTHAEAKALAEHLGAALRITKDGRFAALTLPEGTDIRAVYGAKENRAYIEDMTPDFYAQTTDLNPARPNYTVSDSEYPNQEYLDYLNMGDTWSTTRGAGITVAVIDTGIDTDHPEFAGRISEYSYNATEDKIVKDYNNDWSLIEDEVGHGTAVTGVIAGAMNGSGIVGIAPQVEILVIKAECDQNGDFLRTSDLVFGLYYAIERDVDIVNMSFGGGLNVYADAARLAVDSDIICVAAAGNDGTTMLTYPAADENVIGVGALEAGGWQLAGYSNYGENSELVAPGTTYTSKMGGGYGPMTGTSLACPTVVGGIALYLSRNKYATFDQVTENLYASCADLGDLGEDWYYGYGTLDIHALVCQERGALTFNMLTDELDNTQQIFIREHTLQNIPEPERTYAVFDGWYYDIDCTEPLNLYVDVFHTDLTLYAKWVNEDDGVPYTYVELDDGTIEIRSYTGKRRYITVPEYIDGKVVSSIGEDAFAGNTRLREVELPAQLKRIRDRAFAGCSNLVFLNVPDSVISIGREAFKDNVRLSAVGFGIDSRLESIGDFAFQNCGSIQIFEVPGAVKSLNGSAFYGAQNIRRFSILGISNSFIANNGVLMNKAGTSIVAYPAGVAGTYQVPTGVETIDRLAFAFSKISSIDLKNTKTIGTDAFYSSRLESLVLPDTVASLGDGAFAGNRYLQTLQIGKGLGSISNYAFQNATALKTVTIPANILSVGGAAFAGSGLSELVFAPNSRLTSIGPLAFEECYLKALALPKALTSIGSGAFTNNRYLHTVTFEQGSNLTSIDESAFWGTTSLKSISLPANLRSIGSSAFRKSGLQEVTLPAKLEILGAGAFASCHSLTNIYVEDGNANYVDINGVVYNTGKTEILAYPAGNTRTSYTIEATVTRVGDSAFYGAQKLNQVTMPDSITTVGVSAFCECTKMTAYRLSDSLTTIEESAFASNSSITSYTLPASLTYIQQYAFAENTNLRSLAIPDKVYQISNMAFAFDYNLRSITFTENATIPRFSYGAFAYTGLTSFRVPASVSTIAQGVFVGCEDLANITFAANSKISSISAYMFDGCENLTSITFENGSALTSIQAHGFEGMSKLTSVNFGDAKLTNIDNYAFRYCESLKTLDLPADVTFIGRYAFYGCRNLESLVIPETMEHIGENAFYMAEKLNIYFAADTLPAYLKSNWDNGIRGYYIGVNEIKESGDWKYAVLNSGNVSIVEYLGTAENVDMTALNLGGDIVSIGGYAFYGKNIKSITLPKTLVDIHRYAFAQTELTGIALPSGLRFIGQYAFSGSSIGSVQMNNALTTLEQYAFAGCKNLKSIQIPASLATMGRYAFSGSGLEVVDFSKATLDTIPEGAFMGSSLKNVTLPNSLSLIDHNAFRDCADLQTVTFGSGELQLMSNVFYNSGLRKVHIPDNLTYIGEYSFVGLTNLTEFTVSATHRKYAAIDGLLYSKDGKKLICAPAGKTGELTLPKELEILGFGAFENSALTKINFHPESNILTFGYRCFYNAAISEVRIPATVVSFDYYAFAMCKNLTTMEIPENTKLKGIYEGAFYGCLKLENISIPDSIVEISDYAFYGCQSLKKLPFSENSELKGIYDYAFAFSGLESLELPDGLVDIGNYAFRGTDLTEITVPSEDPNLLVIGIGAFADCDKLESITLPFIGASFEDDEISWFGYIFGAGGYEANNTYVPESLKTINLTGELRKVGTGAFYGITTPAQLNLPDTVTDIYTCAFGGSTVICEMPNTVSLYYYDVQTGDSMPVTSVEESFFGTGLAGHISLSENITLIGSRAFCGCESLTGIDIPEGVTTIEDYALAYCSSLTKIDFPNKLTYIGSCAFADCSGIVSVVIPEGVSEINWGTFIGCESLSSVTIPKSVVSIEADAAFYYCRGLREIINYSDLQLTIGSADYGGIAYYAEVIVNSDGSKQFKENEEFAYLDTADGFRFSYNESGEYILIAYLGNEDIVTLPIDIQGNSYTIYHFKSAAKHIIIPDGMTAIDNEAFFGCANMESISIPNSVSSIGNSAFEDCLGLTSIALPESVTNIGKGAFYNCEALSNIVLYAKITSINADTFNGCSDLKHITLPDGVETIGAMAFSGCSSLNNIIMPESLTSIGDLAFQSCKSLDNITIPQNVTTIGKKAFIQCSNLTRIYLPDSVSHVGEGAFALTGIMNIEISADHPHLCFMDGVLYDSNVTQIYCCLDYVTDVIIPASITTIAGAFTEHPNLETVTFEEGSLLKSIEQDAFYRCQNLRSITIPDGVTSIHHYAFYYCTALTSITIPESITGIYGQAFFGCEGLCKIINHSSIRFTPGSSENGMLAYYAYMILNADGTTVYRNDENITYMATEDGFVFTQSEGIYRLVAYVGDEDAVTLPTSFEGNDYTIYKFESTASQITIPDGFTHIDDYAFYYCNSITGITLPASVTSIGSYAFYCCENLTSITALGQVTSFGSQALDYCRKLKEINTVNGNGFGSWDTLYYTGYIDHPDNWKNGVLSVGLQIICVKEFVEEVSIEAPIGNGALNEAFKIRKITIDGNNLFYGWSQLSNLETLVFTNLSGYVIAPNQITLKTIVLKEGCDVQSSYLFQNITGVTIYVEADKDNVQWDHDYPGWNNGNKVYYGDEWIEVNFVDDDGSAIDWGYYTINQMIRQPYVSDVIDGDAYKVFVGWDINSDGIADAIPPTSVTDMCAVALYQVHQFDWSVLRESTCTEPGIRQKVCTDCGIPMGDAEEIPATGHSFGAWTQTKAPTCTEKGQERRDCANCDHYETREVAALGHDYKAVVTAPTCTEQGYTTHTCAKCGDSYVDSYVSATGHSFGAWTQTKAPTCTEKGQERRDCVNCDHYETREVAALGHDYKTVVTAPTCTEQGYTTHTCTRCSDSYVDSYVSSTGHSFGNWTQTKAPSCTEKGSERRDCANCDHYETRDVAALGHDYKTVVTAPTCTEKGYTTHTCSRCGDSYVDSYTNATGHSFSNWTQTKAPSCTEKGQERRDCANCDHYETRDIAALSHDYKAVVTAPTCTEQGYTTHTCSRCGNSYVDSYTAALGHAWDNGVVTVEPTEDTEGLRTYTCTRCRTTRTESIPKKDHVHNYTSVVTAPTCTEQGYTTHTCAKCGDSYVDSYTNATGHSFGAWTQTKAPTCTENGQERRDCANCDHYETRDVAALGHDYKAVVTAPTCTERGYTTHTCSRCGDSYVDSYTNATGHSFGAWTQTKAPTCTEKGQERRDCANCDHYETRDVAALGHAWSDWVTVTEPTEETEGKAERTCGSCGAVETKVLPALGHTHNYTPAVTAPTCTEDGYTAYTCRCGESYIADVVPALGHSEVVDPGKEATCTETGLTEGKHCSRCGKILVAQEEIPATGHSFGAWTQATAPTCTEKGQERRDCANCEHYETREIATLGHDYKAVVTEPTCTEQGYTTHTCTHCADSYVDSYTEPLGHTDGAVCGRCGEMLAVWGDVSGDRNVTVQDAILVLRYVAKLVDGSALDLAMADVNGDGAVTVQDAILILRFVAKLINQFPAQK